MDKQQFTTLAIGIKSAYPASKMLEDNASMDFWYMMLRDIPYDTAENAVMEYICTNVYPPNIAEIRKLCMERMKAPVPSYDEAWGAVQKAISNYGRHNPQEAFESMDELTAEVVKNMGWSRLCQSENPAADRANFREAYEAKAAAKQNRSQLPEFVAKQKERLQEKYIPAIEKSATPQLERAEPKQEHSTEILTDEQLKDRLSKIEEVKRRVFGGQG